MASARSPPTQRQTSKSQHLSSPHLAANGVAANNSNKPRKTQLALSTRGSSMSVVNNVQSLENMVLRGEAAHLSVKELNNNNNIKASLDALNQYRQQQQQRLQEKRRSQSSSLDSMQASQDSIDTNSSNSQQSLTGADGSSNSVTSSGASSRKAKASNSQAAVVISKRLIDDRSIAAAVFTPANYTANPHQAAIFNEIFPHPHDISSASFEGAEARQSRKSLDVYSVNSLVANRKFVISQLYSSPFRSESIDTVLLKKIVSRILLSHPVLRSRFSRNDNIIDADVNGHVEGTLSEKSFPPSQGVGKSTNDMSAITDQQVRSEILDAVDQIADGAVHFLSRQESADMTVDEMIDRYGRFSPHPQGLVTFDIVLFLAKESSATPKGEADENWQWLFIYPTIICDEFTGHLISTTILQLYSNQTPLNYDFPEKIDFIHYAIDLHRQQHEKSSNMYKEAVAAYREHLVELDTDKNGHEDIDKVKLRDKIEDHKNTRASIDRQLLDIKQNLENKKSELNTSITQRRLMDLQSIDDLKTTASGSDGSQKPRKNYITYIDSVTGETIIILNHAKEALIQSVLGEEVKEDSILPLLRKHQVSEDSIKKLDAENMEFERFLQCTVSDFESKNIEQGERRQLFALVEYVRGRVKECMEEQAKVKFALERKIQKLEREVNNIAEVQLQNKQLEWDQNEQILINLNAILNPPLIKKMVPVASIPYDKESKYSLVGSFERLGNRGNNSTGYDDQLMDKHVAEADEILQDYAIRNHRLLLTQYHNVFFPIILPENFKQVSQDFSLSWRVPGSPSNNGRKAKDVIALASDTRPSTNFVTCLASFAVLIRHMTGHSKFAIGYHRRLFSDPIGPTAAVVPLKVDMSKKDQTLAELCGQLNRALVLQWEKSHGISLPLTSLREEITRQFNSIPSANFGLSGQLAGSQTSLSSSGEENTAIPLIYPIQYEFWPRDQVIRLKKQGIDVEQWVTGQMPGFNWSINQEEPFDLKLVVVEAADAQDSTLMGIWYNRNRVDFDRIVKWSDRLLSILANLDYSNHKLTLSHIVGRFYQRVFTNYSANSLAAGGTENKILSGNKN